jgi:phosphatidylglycerophosphate synthase
MPLYDVKLLLHPEVPVPAVELVPAYPHTLRIVLQLLAVTGTCNHLEFAELLYVLSVLFDVLDGFLACVTALPQFCW